jgi:type IV secretory pathway TrbF-like protein
VTRLIRASEIGAFAFCERAWGYAARGEPSERQPEIEAGQHFHERRLRRVTWSQAVRCIGIACLVLAAAALAIALTT